MDSDTISKIITLLILIVLSAFFSASETAFSSANPIRLKIMKENGSKGAAQAIKLVKDYDKLISSILIGNNIVNIASASIGTLLFVELLGNIGATVSTAVITIAVLIFGEITPKTMAKEHPEEFACFVAPVFRLLNLILTPVNYLLSKWTLLVAKIFKGKKKRAITEEELLTFVDEAENEGAINKEDRDLINSVIEYNDLRAIDILTPRVDIDAVSITAGYDEIAAVFWESSRSRLPVYDETLDDIVGVINFHDFFSPPVSQTKNVSACITPILFTPPGTKISDLLKQCQKEKNHMAVVTDEFGGTLGIVTVEDIIEELVGEIWDEHDEIIQEFERLDNKKYKILCSADIDDLFESFNITGKTQANTVSGWVMEQLDRMPQNGDTFEYENLKISVTKTDQRRAIEIVLEIMDEK